MKPEPAKTRPTFGLWALVALVVGNAVGAGIYTTSGFSLADLGSVYWVMLAWLVAGLIALCGALSYGMLVARLSESGGEYLYLSRSIHPIAGYVAGWISLLAGFPGAIAFAATAFESYSRAAVPELAALPNDLLAISVVLLAGVIHLYQVRVGARIHELVVLLMLGILILLGAYGLFWIVDQQAYVSSAVPKVSSFSIVAFANTLVWISLSYSGFNAAAYIAGEVRNAATVVPRGMVYGTLATILLCLLVNAVFLFSVPAEALSGRADIALISANAIAGDFGVRLMQIVIAVSLLTSITAMALAGPRVYAKMADDGALPKLFAFVPGKPPRASIVLQIVITIALISVADLRGLLSYLGLTLSLCLALAVSSLFVGHYLRAERPQSVFYPYAPIIFVVSTTGFAVLSALHSPLQFIAALPTIAAGAVFYWLQQRRANS